MSGRRGAGGKGGRVTGRTPHPGPPPPGGRERAGAEGPPAPAARTLKIGKVAAFGLEFGPFEVPLPGRFLPALVLVLLLVVATAAGVWLAVLRPPMEEARAALRLARYDSALAALERVPGWLADWPGLAALRDQARLGNDLNTPPQDWPALGLRLRGLRARAPQDVALMVLDAGLALHADDVTGAAVTLESAVAADPENAQAWFLLGLVRDLTGDAPAAIDHYRRALALAPESPEYRGNLARALLDQGETDAALAEYRKISRFPLARLEQALAHWARGEWGEAAQAQTDALALLADPQVMKGPPNRLGWRFVLRDRPPPDNGVALSGLTDKRCYALLGQAVSRRLAAPSVRAWSPPRCGDAPGEAPPPAIRALVADDLCRFVDHWQPALRGSAAAVRRALGGPAVCP